MMTELVINPRFETLLRFLNDEELAELEASILEEGIREPIRVWRDTIVDGHHRYKLATKHGLDFPVRNEFFDSEDSACLWIIRNQCARRNLTDNERVLYIGLRYELLKKLRGAQSGNENAAKNKPDSLSDSFLGGTAAQVAAEVNVSERTVHRASKVAQAFEDAPEELQEAFKRNEITQTKLIENIKPFADAKAPARVGDKKHDNFTKGMRELGQRMQLAIGKVWQIAEDMGTVCQDNGLNLRFFAPEIASLHAKLKDEKHEAWVLKTLERCPQPAPDNHINCQFCSQSGYIPSPDLDDQDVAA